MFTKKREWLAEILAAVINLFLAVFVLVIGKLGELNIGNDIQFISVSIVVSLTLVIFIFKNDITSKMSERIELYRLLDTINDHELRELGVKQIQNCTQRLEELSRGQISGSIGLLHELLSSKVGKATRSVFATHAAMYPQEIYQWEESQLALKYFQINSHLVDKGVDFERVFVLRRSSFLDIKTGKFDSRSVRIIKGQEKANIKVHIVWEEQLEDKALWEDFVVIDSELVYLSEPTGSAFSGGLKAHIETRSFVVEEYISKFRTLVNAYSMSIDKAFK